MKESEKERVLSVSPHELSGPPLIPSVCRRQRQGRQIDEGQTTGTQSSRDETRSSVDFFTVETVWLQRLYVLFFIELGSRRVHFAECTHNPSGTWVTQQGPATDVDLG